MNIAIGNDHAATDLKKKIKALLNVLGHTVADFGTSENMSVDYPDFGCLVSKAVSTGEVDRGVLICGTGIGMSIVANKFRGVRAALCHDLFTARMSRMHNNANILVMGSRTLGIELATAITRAWFETEFDGGRHENRIRKISEIEGLICNGTEIIERS